MGPRKASSLDERVISSLDDRLNHAPLRKLLVDDIAARVEDGRGGMLALFGPWGSGKTSVIEGVRDEIENQKLSACWITFDAWAYQTGTGLVAPLLTQLARARVSAPEASSLRRVLLATVMFSADAALGLLGVKDATDTARKNLELADSLLKQATDPQTAIREEISAEVARVVAKTKKKIIVVVVDNLDRCAPDAALSLIESLFVMGDVGPLLIICVADQDVLIDFIGKKYGIAAVNGARYLEKIFPDYVRVPDPWVFWHEMRGPTLEAAAKQQDDVATLLSALLADAANPGLTTYRDLLWYAFSQAAALRNPRRIKRLMRRLRAFDCATASAQTFECVLLIVILTDLWPHIERYRRACEPAQWTAFITGVAGGTPHAGPQVDHEFQNFVIQMMRTFPPPQTPPAGVAPPIAYHLALLGDHDTLEGNAKIARGLGL